MSTQSGTHASENRFDEMARAMHICFLLALLIFFNIYPDKVGVYENLLAPSSFTPVLAQGFYAALPWLNAWWLASLALATVLLISGKLSRELRLAGWAVDLLGIAVLWRLVTGDALLLPIPAWPMSAWTVNTLVRVVLGLALLGQTVGAPRDLVRLLPAWVPELRREAHP